MTLNVNDVIRTVVQYTYPGAGSALNIFHHALLGGSADEQDVIDALVTWLTDEWGAHWANNAATVATLVGAQFEVVNNLGEVLSNLGSEVLSIPGTQSSEVLPAANAGFIQAYTATPGVRGSKYIPGFAEVVNEDGQWSAAGLANLAFLLLDFLETVNVGTGINLFPVVRSTKLNGFPRLINAGSINSLPAYQRRRKEGVGT